MTNLRVVIPAKEEDKYLTSLLNQLKLQTYNNFEVTVADSSKSTIVKDICKSFSVSVVEGGLPSTARNNGALNFNGNFLMFLDADVIIQNDFIQRALFHVEAREVDCLSFGFSPEKSNFIMNFIHSMGTNLFWFLTKIGIAHGIGGAILIKNGVHKKIQGFDETIYLAEDHNYVSRASKVGKYTFARTLKVRLSTRRFEKEGVISLCLKYVTIGFHRLILGEIRDNKIPYFENTQ